MIDYTGAKCPACKETFKDGDDIVVCPDCGAPHHRKCFLETGSCRYEKHSEGNWKNDNADKEEEAKKYFGKELKCEICNAPYEYGDEFCGVCGARLGERKDAEDKKEYTGPVIPPNPYTTPFGGIDENAELEGVSAKEMAIFTGNKSYYFLPRFMLFAQGVRAITLNLFGFLFGAFYMLYRKMYVWGIVFLVITIALAV
ncbi:MAG: DUF2628 domain-containing protein, partial [Oscillospiraceae bacterium]|nr:DUF2628 domain-containing protein [Oscillospiraceae bacterium]